MELHTRRLALIFASSALVAVGVLVACDTDNGTVPLPGQTSSSSSSGKPVVEDDDDGDDDDDTDGGKKADGGDAGCGDVPRLRSTDAGFYCPFLDRSDAGRSSCTNDEVCCNPGRDGTTILTSYCAAATTKNNVGNATCEKGADAGGLRWIETGGAAWECSSSANCGGTKKCCVYEEYSRDAAVDDGPAGGNGAPPKTCNVTWLYNTGGSKCANSCGPREKELCSRNDPCPDGKTCKPVGFQTFRDVKRHVGICVD